MTATPPPAEAEATPAATPEATTPDKPPAPVLNVELGAQTWFLPTARINPDFNNDDKYHAQDIALRIRLQGKFSIGPLSAFVQLQDARSWGNEASSTSNEKNVDLHQGYLELGGEKGIVSGYIRAGRQQIDWGTARMMGSLPWAVFARSFDAIRIAATFQKKYTIDIFAAVLSPPTRFTVNADPMNPAAGSTTYRSTGHNLIGAEAPLKFHQAIEVTPRILTEIKRQIWHDRSRPPTANDLLDQTVVSPGADITGSPYPGIKYDVEGYYQVGERKTPMVTRKHRAWAWVADIGYTHEVSRFKPKFTLRYAMASGEKCNQGPMANGMPVPCKAAGDDSNSTEFYNFYPTNHTHYGFMDLFGWRNMRNFEARVGFKPHKILDFEIAYHNFQLHEPTGRWSNTGGGNVGRGWDPTNTDRNLGHEIEAWFQIKPWGETLWLQPGYGVFIPTGAGKKLGGSDPQQFVWLWMVGNFGNSKGK